MLTIPNWLIIVLNILNITENSKISMINKPKKPTIKDTTNVTAMPFPVVIHSPVNSK